MKTQSPSIVLTSPVPPADTISRTRRTWPLLLAVALFIVAVPPLMGGAVVPGRDISPTITQVLFHPWIESVPALLPVAKLALLAVAVIGVMARPRWFATIVVGYYAAALVLVAAFQNTASLPGGRTVVLGNLLAQLTVATGCLVALRPMSGQVGGDACVLRHRLWVLPLMAWAWWCPYALVAGSAVVGDWGRVLVNNAGVTYCMVTPVVAGVMVLRPHAYPQFLRTLIGWSGTLFGVLNMWTWFGAKPDSWWMGVVHIPLLLISLTLVITTFIEGRAERAELRRVRRLS